MGCQLTLHHPSAHPGRQHTGSLLPLLHPQLRVPSPQLLLVRSVQCREQACPLHLLQQQPQTQQHCLLLLSAQLPVLLLLLLTLLLQPGLQQQQPPLHTAHLLAGSSAGPDLPHHQLLTVLLSQRLQLHRLLPLPLLLKLLQPQPHAPPLQLVTSPLLLQLLVTPLVLVPLQLLALVVHQQLPWLRQPLHQLLVFLPWCMLLPVPRQQLRAARSMPLQQQQWHQRQQLQQQQTPPLLL